MQPTSVRKPSSSRPQHRRCFGFGAKNTLITMRLLIIGAAACVLLCRWSLEGAGTRWVKTRVMQNLRVIPLHAEASTNQDIFLLPVKFWRRKYAALAMKVVDVLLATAAIFQLLSPSFVSLLPVLFERMLRKYAWTFRRVPFFLVAKMISKAMRHLSAHLFLPQVWLAMNMAIHLLDASKLLLFKALMRSLEDGF